MARISISEETRYGPGWVRIAVSPPLQQPVTGVVLARRQSDKPYLGLKGWQSQRHGLVPEQTEDADRATVLLFGPGVTRHLMLDMDVDVSIEGAGIQERHFWPDIMGAQPDAQGRIAGIRQIDPPITGGGSGTTQEGTSAGEPPPLEPPVQTNPQDGAPPQSGWRLYAALGLLALLLLAGGAYLLTGRDDPVIAAPAPAEQPRSEPGEDAGSQPPGFAQRYETYRDAGGHADELFRLFGEAQAAGEYDIAERAIVLAETRGSAEAMLQMGRWKDPGQPADRFSDPQPSAAARYYRRAAEAGQAGADALLSQLCSRSASPPEGEIQLFQNFPSGEYCR